MNKKSLTPKFFSLLKNGISKQQIMTDVSAGIIVGIIALPLAIAFAIASGVTPERGIITAIIAGLIISVLGGSRVQIGGPTGAFIVLVFSIVSTYGIEGLLIATFLAGLILVLMGLLRMGALLKYIPQTLITGFTTGIAVLIFTTQVKDFLGLEIKSLPSEFIHKWISYLTHLHSINLWSVLIGLFTIFTIIYFPKLTKKIPGTFVAIIISSLIVYFFKLPIETIATRFGSISAALPKPQLFHINLATINTLLLPAFAIAILGALESLLCAVVADSMIGSKHRSNAELIAQGLANIITPLFGGIPATGAIARTATNIKNGGKTPISGITHALTLLIFFLIAMPIIQYIPLATLAGILIIVAWNMSEIPAFIHSCKINIHETLVLLTTFALTLFTDLTIAIPIGFILATLLFMKRMSDSVEITPLAFEKKDEDHLFSQELGKFSNNIKIFEINGPLFFGSVDEFLNLEKSTKEKNTVIILRMRYVPIIDATGLKRLKEVSREFHKKHIKLIISGANEKIAVKLEKFNITEQDYIIKDIREAIDIAKKIS